MILGKIERMARFILQELSIHQPPICVDTIATRLGLQVIDDHFESSDILGMLYLDKDKAMYVIGVNSAHGEHQRRFTIAHQIGHFLLHPKQKIRLDRGPFTLTHSSVNLSNSVIVQENREASAFATALLLPESFVHQVVEDKVPRGFNISDDNIEELAQLAKMFKVSPLVFGVRIGSLGYV